MYNMLSSSVDLTQVREHLELFSILKGVEEDSLEGVVTNMADEVSSIVLSLTTLIFITKIYKYSWKSLVDHFKGIELV